MKLYWAPASPFARKVRVVARERGLTALIEELAVDVAAQPTDLTAANPLGKIPALVLDDGEPLFDSPVICAFLDAHHAARGAPLCPPSGPDRWRVLRAEALADGAMDLSVSLVYERRRPEGERSPATVEKWRGQLRRALDAMMPEIAGLPGGVTLGSIAMACALGYLDLRHPDMNWRDGRDKLAQWFEELSRRPSLAGTAPS